LATSRRTKVFEDLVFVATNKSLKLSEKTHATLSLELSEKTHAFEFGAFRNNS
jgi:hypothetical protein